MSRARPVIAALVVVGVLGAVGGTLVAPRAHGGDDKPAAPAIAVVKIPTARGVALEGSLHKPAKANACNAVAVVIAPGQGGGREKPVSRKSAEAFAAAGFPVVRFDWAYFSAKKEPSEDLSTEVADLEAAIEFARKQPGIAKVIVGGKSLGTLAIARRLEKKSDDLAALLLFTLPLTNGDPAATPREGTDSLLHTTVPTLVVVGDHDPLCPLATLYDFASKCDVKPRVVVVPGDHGLAKGKGDESETDDNVGLCAAAAVLWARRFVGT